MTEWKSGDNLINNRLTNAFHDSLRKCTPELSEMLFMWDGDYEPVRWLLSGVLDSAINLWDEILSRIEFWVSRGHSRYTLKWFVVLRTLLASSKARMVSVAQLGDVLSEREAGMSFEYWIERMSSLLPETEVDTCEEISVICALCREVTCAGDERILLGETATRFCI
jgi:hypothetical protein